MADTIVKTVKKKKPLNRNLYVNMLLSIITSFSGSTFLSTIILNKNSPDSLAYKIALLLYGCHALITIFAIYYLSLYRKNVK